MNYLRTIRKLVKRMHRVGMIIAKWRRRHCANWSREWNRRWRHRSTLFGRSGLAPKLPLIRSSSTLIRRWVFFSLKEDTLTLKWNILQSMQTIALHFKGRHSFRRLPLVLPRMTWSRSWLSWANKRRTSSIEMSNLRKKVVYRLECCFLNRMLTSHIVICEGFQKLRDTKMMDRLSHDKLIVKSISQDRHRSESSGRSREQCPRCRTEHFWRANSRRSHRHHGRACTACESRFSIPMSVSCLVPPRSSPLYLLSKLSSRLRRRSIVFHFFLSRWACLK